MSSQIGSLSRLLNERVSGFATKTNDMFDIVGPKLTPAALEYYQQPDTKRIMWTEIEYIAKSETVVIITGFMSLELGEVVDIGGTLITIDEKSILQYNKTVKFVFPLVMLELGTHAELVEHVTRMGQLAHTMELTAERLAEVVGKIGKDFEEKVLNDPARITVLDTATKPAEILGFAVTDLTDEQIQKLKLFENRESGLAN